jgi:peptidyl-prolyl cis-trans isomerase SurA
MLIDDTIKISEGTVILSGNMSAINQGADRLINSTFAQNNENPDDVLASLDIPREVIHKKFKADIIWASIINNRFQGQFANAEAEAEIELERLKQNLQEPHINLDEIVLLPEPNRNYAATINLASQMVNAIRKGADFGRIAQQYSAAGSASNGGNIGWVLESRIESDFRDILTSLKPGDITDPIDRDGAIIIYRVKGRRDSGHASPLEAEVILTRLLYPMTTIDEASRLEVAAKLTRETEAITTCQDLEVLNNTYGAGLPFMLGRMPLYNLAPNLRDLIAPLEAGMKTGPVAFNEGMAIFMVCDKSVPNTDLPSLETLTKTIQNRYFSILSQRHLNQLRREALVDIRKNF